MEKLSVLNHTDISQQDPLDLDAFMRNLPTLNRRRDVRTLLNKLRSNSSVVLETSGWNPVGSSAALRDLGMIAASIKRHGFEATNLTPDLSSALLKLAEISGTVPRDTVFSYGPWNPEGQRRRRFTDLNEEEMFIASFTRGMSGLDRSIESLCLAQELGVASTDFTVLVDHAEVGVQQMVGAIVKVHRDVSPEIFTRDLRPYFDPIRIGETDYLGPGGAQMPLLLVDFILWGSDIADLNYQSYMEKNLEYTPPPYRELCGQLVGLPSIVTLMEAEVNSRESTFYSNQAIGSVQRILGRLISFRMPHLMIAKKNFQLRKSDDVGSGGYDPTILEYLIDKTEESRRRLVPNETI